MSGLAHHHRLAALHPPPRPASHFPPPPPTPPIPSSVHKSYPHTSSPAPRMDPLDLLSRVALGQYPTPPTQSQPKNPQSHAYQALDTWPHPAPSQTQVHFTSPSMLKHEPLEPSPSATVQDARYRRLEYTPPSHSAFPPSTIPTSFPPVYPIPTRENCNPDFSPVSSDDGLPSTSARHARQQPEDSIGPVTKVMRTSKDASVHKPRSQPSRFCHICSRTSKKVGLVSCGNFSTGACRKVVCQKCFNDHNWDWEKAVEMGSEWICTHCRQDCPERAQCAIYKRTNERRREQQQYQRSLKAESGSNIHRQKGLRSGGRQEPRLGTGSFQSSEGM